ncbi:hypothetical protein PH210_08120 [Paenibacillus sp. BSR1-1]|uniref:hypothetical protein n=1 Tax=Paenibacillus sp. BSR1-1 TaxID=3020845 RepID=UPI0025B278B5|nr:hypothetical protein [Paenibacillus sp. BSR1-1]MDN3016163.1 hypothetical protein [Paenibacillus sp. BSR1-1]
MGYDLIFLSTSLEKEKRTGRGLFLTDRTMEGKNVTNENRSKISSKKNPPSTAIPNHVSALNGDKYSIGIMNVTNIRPPDIPKIRFFELNFRFHDNNKIGEINAKSNIDAIINKFGLLGNN